MQTQLVTSVVAVLAVFLMSPDSAAAGMRLSADRVDANTLKVRVTLTSGAERPIRARVAAEGCARPSPTWLACGPGAAVWRTVLLWPGRKRKLWMIVRRLVYAPVGYAAGLHPHYDRFVAAETDVAYMTLVVQGQQRTTLRSEPVPSL